MYSVHNVLLTQDGFPHSDISGSMLICQLPETFRRLSRLSSPPTAQAFPVCASFLDSITFNGFVYLKRLVTCNIPCHLPNNLSIVRPMTFLCLFFPHLFKELTTKNLKGPFK